MVTEQTSVSISRKTRMWAFTLLALVLVMGFGALLSSYLEYQQYMHNQQVQGHAVEARLCATLDRLAALKPPAGNATDNPSRSYEQQLAATLSELKTDIGCSP